MSVHSLSGNMRGRPWPRKGPAPARLLALLALVFTALTGSGHAQAVKSGSGQWVIRLRTSPALDQARLEPGTLRSALSASPAANEVATRLKAVRSEQQDVRTRLADIGSAHLLARTELVLNSLIVELPADQLAAVRAWSEVADVYPSVEIHKAMDAALQLVRAPQAWALRAGGENAAGEGIKIAVIDTGLDINNPMLQDPTLVAPADFPKFTQSIEATCTSDDRQFTNSKVIVARNYVRLLSSRDPNCDAMDRDGHGTFSATVAAGRRVAAPLASISGVAPRAYLGNYKVFGTPGSNGSASLGAVLAAIDDAVRDGMDVINMSLGANLGLSAASDPLAIAVKNAVNAGVVVVAAAGNDGPGSATVSSPGIAPEAITVGASTNSRALALPLELTSAGVVPASLQQLPATLGVGVTLSVAVGPLPLRDVASLGDDASACSALEAGALRGAMALIERGGCAFQVKITNALAAGAAAVLLFNNQSNQPAIGFTPGTATQIPSVMIGNAEGLALRSFLPAATSTVNARLGAVRLAFPAEANRIASFSSAGPTIDFNLKPELSAPGANIYAGTQRNSSTGEQFDASGFGTSQGTSVSSPVVAGAAALVRQQFRQFTPAQVKSVLVQTAANVLLPAAGGSSGVVAGGNGLLDAQAAVSAPAVIVPSSINLGSNAPGTQFLRSVSLTLTNAGSAADTFTLTQRPEPQSIAVSVEPSSASLTIAAGASAVLALNISVPPSAAGVAEGRLEFRSQSTGRVLTVPYWGVFLRPVVNLTGVVNAASFTAGSTQLAPGSLISIFGTQMATGTAAATSLPLPTALAGVRVLVNDVAAPLLFVSPSQINAQVPYEVANSSLGLLKVTVHGQTSAQVPFQIALAAPGIFSLNQSGAGRGAVLHGTSGAAVTDANPARPGEVLSVFVSGLGSTNPAATSGAAATGIPLQSTTRPVTASIGGLSAPVSFSGLAPGFVGLYQVNVQVPDGVAAGEQTLQVTCADVLSNAVTLPVQR